jgi:two-component sensor histidine kinase
MALLHETLYRTGIFASVNLGDYLRNVTTQLFRAQRPSSGSLSLRLDLVAAQVGIDQAIPCGLIVNELVSNSLKHAFAPGGDGEVAVELHQDADRRLHLRVSDTGVGLAPDFETTRSASLGLQLVSDLARQLRGVLLIGGGPHASFELTFSPAEPKGALPELADSPA